MNRILFAILLIHVGLALWSNRGVISQKFDIQKYELIYQHSPYNPQNEYWGVIQDNDLYSLAGYRYVTGADPSSINFELQPLTKYFFGISILLFGNAVIAQILIAFVVLFLVYVNAYEIFKNRFLSLLPLLIFSFDRLFVSELTSAYLDLSQTAWILLFIYGLNRKPTLKSIIFVGFALGGIALSKSFLIGLVAAAIGTIYLIIGQKISIKRLLIMSLTAITFYCLGYAPYLIHHSIIDFIKLHLDIIRLYRSNVPEYPLGEVFRILFMGQWRRWFGDFGLAPVPEFTLLWPLAMITFIVHIIFYRNKPKFSLHYLWVVGYLATLSLKLVFPRYLLPILPSLYIILISVIINLI